MDRNRGKQQNSVRYIVESLYDCEHDLAVSETLEGIRQIFEGRERRTSGEIQDPAAAGILRIINSLVLVVQFAALFSPQQQQQPQPPPPNQIQE